MRYHFILIGNVTKDLYLCEILEACRYKGRHKPYNLNVQYYIDVETKTLDEIVLCFECFKERLPESWFLGLTEQHVENSVSVYEK